MAFDSLTISSPSDEVSKDYEYDDREVFIRAVLVAVTILRAISQSIISGHIFKTDSFSAPTQQALSFQGRNRYMTLFINHTRKNVALSFGK